MSKNLKELTVKTSELFKNIKFDYANFELNHPKMNLSLHLFLISGCLILDIKCGIIWPYQVIAKPYFQMELSSTR